MQFVRAMLFGRLYRTDGLSLRQASADCPDRPVWFAYWRAGLRTRTFASFFINSFDIRGAKRDTFGAIISDQLLAAVSAES